MQYSTARVADGVGSDPNPIRYAATKRVNTVCRGCTLVRGKRSGVLRSQSELMPPSLSLQWEKLQMTASERRKIMCSVTFHVIAITCVVWSLYVLIDRTAEEIKQGQSPLRSVSLPSLTYLADLPLFCSVSEIVLYVSVNDTLLLTSL